MGVVGVLAALSTAATVASAIKQEQMAQRQKRELERQKRFQQAQAAKAGAQQAQAQAVGNTTPQVDTTAVQQMLHQILASAQPTTANVTPQLTNPPNSMTGLDALFSDENILAAIQEALTKAQRSQP